MLELLSVVDLKSPKLLNVDRPAAYFEYEYLGT